MTATLIRPNMLSMAMLLTALVNPQYFVEATRESGYKGTTNATAELIDTSRQARATNIHFLIEVQNDGEVWVYILDDGTGMDAATLTIAPQFGGTTRFDDRDGIGRFSMELPNASVSQCRRMEVYSKQAGSSLLRVCTEIR